MPATPGVVNRFHDLYHTIAWQRACCLVVTSVLHHAHAHRVWALGNPSSSMRPGNTRQSRARLIVCERTGKWAVALRRSAEIGSFRVHETRSLEECRDEVQASPASLVAVEATTANVDNLLDWLTDIRRDFPQAHVVVLGDRGLEREQWLWREAGAVHVIHSPRRVDEVLRIAWRHLEAARAKEPLTREQFMDRILW